MTGRDAHRGPQRMAAGSSAWLPPPATGLATASAAAVAGYHRLSLGAASASGSGDWAYLRMGPASSGYIAPVRMLLVSLDIDTPLSAANLSRRLRTTGGTQLHTYLRLLCGQIVDVRDIVHGLLSDWWLSPGGRAPLRAIISRLGEEGTDYSHSASDYLLNYKGLRGNMRYYLSAHIGQAIK